MLFLVVIICCLVGPPSEVAQGPLLELILGYLPLEVAWEASSVKEFHSSVLSLVEGHSWEILFSCFRTDICLLPNVVSGLSGIRFRRAWVRSEVVCVSISFDDILGNGRVSWENSVVS